MRVCTVEQMRTLDRLTIEKYGTPGEVLMERAGRWVALVADYLLSESEGETVCVVAGRGNNGGDGFVAARYLFEAGYEVSVVLCGDPDTLKGDALLNYNRARERKIPIIRFEGELPAADLYVDALLGTGISGAPRGEVADAIKLINSAREKYGAFVVAVDIPSGVNGDNGEVPGEAVWADFTVTFGFPKVGQFVHPGRAHTGTLAVGKIGLDERALAEVPITYEVSTIQEIAELLPVRPPDGHKGTFGRGLIIAGSPGMTGAAALAGLSFLRSGAGLCYAAVPRSLVDVIDTIATEVVVLTMPEVRKKRCHTLRALGELHKVAREVDVVAIGPGLGRHHETQEMVRRFLRRIQTPVVIDADALNALAGELNDTIPQITAPSVMTPHLGELSRILEMPIEEIKSQRVQKAAEWAKFLYTTLVIKGNPTFIASEGHPIYINPTGNDAMATAGSGDVLTGLIAGFMAQGLSPLQAAIVGTYIHGLAGELAGDYYGNRSTIAGDILDSVPEAIKSVEMPPYPVEMTREKWDFGYIITDLGAEIVQLEYISG